MADLSGMDWTGDLKSLRAFYSLRGFYQERYSGSAHAAALLCWKNWRDWLGEWSWTRPEWTDNSILTRT